VDRSATDRDLAGTWINHRATGAPILLVPWVDRYSHFDMDYNEIGLGGPSGRTLSHQLLLVHEISHIIEPTEERHGPLWVGAFLALIERRLPRLRPEVEFALRAHDVSWT
jgi:hypothetical protein